jgi:hypothetical protein
MLIKRFGMVLSVFALLVAVLFIAIGGISESAVSPARGSGLADQQLAGSDWIERHPTSIGANKYTGSDWIERHPTSIGANKYTGSDWIERHPTGIPDSAARLQMGNTSGLEAGNSISENGHTYAGTGDPFRFRARLSISGAALNENGHTYSGTGDPPGSR